MKLSKVAGRSNVEVSVVTMLVPDGQFTGATKRIRLVAGITLAETTSVGSLTITAHAHPTMNMRNH